MKIRPTVFSFVGAIIISLFFTLSLFWIFYEYAGSLNSGKEAISTLGGYFGGIATLWAAIIAAYLFNDWRDIERFKATQTLHNDGVDALLVCSKELNRIVGQLSLIEMLRKEAEESNTHLSPDKQKDLTKSLSETTKEVIINVQNVTFNICVKIAMDYTKPLNNDPDLKFIFETLTGVKDFVQKIAHDRGISDTNINEIRSFINNFNMKIDKKMYDRNLK